MMSLPAWECGLKLEHPLLSQGQTVTPRVGVWIETSTIGHTTEVTMVTPRVGVWIETIGTTTLFGC